MTRARFVNIKVYLSSLLLKKPESLVVLDLRHLDAEADFFIICHGKSTRQVTAFAEHLKRDLKKININPLSTEGVKEGHWALLDYGTVVVHLFQESFRKFYNLEALWSSAISLEINNLKDEITSIDSILTD